MQNRYLQIVEKINYYLFVVAICMLPFPTRISLYAWELWLFSWLLEGRFLRKENLQWHKGIMPIILCVVWVLWELISCTWAINKTDAFNMIVRHLSFVMILPVAVWGVNEQYDLWKAAKYFVISSIASVFIYCAYLYIIQQWGYLYEFHHLPEGVLSLEYFGNNISLTKHRLYYGTVLNLAIVALLINYLKLDSVKGSIFDSHFRFQIRTFWWYLAWTVIAFVPFVFVLFTGQDAALFATVTLAATIFCVSVLVLSWLWIVYRAIKGIIRLNDNRAI